MIPRVTATVDLSAVRHNLAAVRRHAPGTRVMAVIKADAYGHGAVQVARALEGRVDAFAVACMEEALVLREARMRAPLVLLEGVLSMEEARLVLRHDLQVVVHDDWQLALLEQLPKGAGVSLWLKLDTGMHRLGFPPGEAARLWERVRARSDWNFCGWMTHLACADETDSPRTQQQLSGFRDALGNLPGARSIANSAGLLAWPEARADWVRPGLALFGASPIAHRSAAELGLRPAMQVESRLIAVSEYERGAAVGYGASYTCPERMRVGVASVGYADGYHRSIAAGTPVWVRGQRAPLVGRISMDMISMDLRAVPDAGVGDPVLLWGGSQPVEEIAAAAGTIAWELLCGLTRRVHFVHVESQKN